MKVWVATIRATGFIHGIYATVSSIPDYVMDDDSYYKLEEYEVQ